MGLASNILGLLNDEGYRINEAIKDALDDFLIVVEEEGEDMAEDLGEDFDDADE